MPVVDVVVLLVLLEHHVGVAVVELTVELGVLPHWLELLDAIHLQLVLARLGEEGISLGLELPNVLV